MRWATLLCMNTTYPSDLWWLLPTSAQKWHSQQTVPSSLGLQERSAQDRIKQDSPAVLLHPILVFEGAPSLCSDCSLWSHVQSITGSVAYTNACFSGRSQPIALH